MILSYSLSRQLKHKYIKKCFDLSLEILFTHKIYADKYYFTFFYHNDNLYDLNKKYA